MKTRLTLVLAGLFLLTLVFPACADGASVIYGSDAIAGVINIIRRKDSGRSYVSSSIEGGSFDSLDASVEAGYTANRWRVNAWLSHLDTDGNNLSRTGDEADGAENTSGNIMFDVQASDAIDLHLSAQRV